MTAQSPQPVPEGLHQGQPEALLASAAAEREQAEALAGVLEDIAAHGVPALEDCVPAAEAHDAMWARVTSGAGRVA
ncbi:hypothetical protein [Streptomyces sp. MI02-7b]|uniref:hypothetical protein n=1 Tax=Streptomyces sp. MI02-7b TaxID=462941 RepID=UPI0029A9F396|nr:hypothetical protein [Streptomyces sp. MI02-7b]MDX3075850.1 hypothetical protein [Streptomyces sp. MI02-7b]